MGKALARTGWVLGAALCAAMFAPPPPPALRSSLRAAYQAFRDPSLVVARAAPRAAPPPAPRPAPTPGGRKPMVEDQDVEHELGGAAPDPLDDPEGGPLAALTLPDLRVPITRRALRYARYFSRTEAGRKVFLGCYRRGTAHRVAIEEALRKAELPLDLTWLPAIESGFDPRAVSPAGAAGLWQLMPETARAHGLVRTTWVDERLDVPLATRAAVALLRELHDRFGRWDLALAAYNAGSGRVESAIERFARERREPDAGARAVTFADLAGARLLPDETAAYVPQIVGFALVAINAEALGIDIPDAVVAADVATLVVPGGTRVETIARAASLGEDALRALNPSLLGDRVAPTGEQRIRVPADRAAAARAALPSMHENEVVLPNDEEDDRPPAGPDAPDEPPPSRVVASEPPGAPARPSPAVSAAVAARVVPRPAQSLVPRSESPSAIEPVAFALGGPPSRPAEDRALPVRPLEPSPEVAKSATAESPEGEGAVAAVEEPPADPMRVQELPNGVVVRVRRDPAATAVTISTRLATVGEQAKDGASEATVTREVRPRDLVAGLELAAARLRAGLGDAIGLDVYELRRRAGAARRKQLEQAAYGRSWIVLGDTLFPLSPQVHPLAGTVLGATADSAALREVLLADLVQRERGTARGTLTVVGDVDEGHALRLASVLAGSIPAPTRRDLAVRPERVLLAAPVIEPRALYGWVARADGVEEEAALRTGLELLDAARIERVLTGDVGLASEAHVGAEQVASRTWVITVELSVAPGHTVNELERALDAELAHLGDEGAEAAEVRAAAARAREALTAELAAADAVTGPAGGPSLALMASLRRAIDGDRGAEVVRKLRRVDAAAVTRAMRRFLPADRRVVVITSPRGHGAEQRIAAR